MGCVGVGERLHDPDALLGWIGIGSSRAGSIQAASQISCGLGVGVDGQGVEAQSGLLAGLAGVDVERAGLGTGSSQDRNLVAQHEQLDVFGRCCAAEQHQPSEEPTQDQV